MRSHFHHKISTGTDSLQHRKLQEFNHYYSVGWWIHFLHISRYEQKEHKETCDRYNKWLPMVTYALECFVGVIAEVRFKEKFEEQ